MTRKNQRARKKRSNDILDPAELELVRARIHMHQEAIRLDRERNKTKRIYEV